MTTLNTDGDQLAQHLALARLQGDSRKKSLASLQKVHVVGAGGTITAAYEQLRNAAEYAEEHVLLQRAIRRFYKRLFMLRDKKRIETSGEELIIELTHAGYIANDSIAEDEMNEMSSIAARYFAAYEILQKRRGITYQQVERWTYDVLAVEIEWRLNDDGYLQALTHFAHSYFMKTLDVRSLFGETPRGFDISLYVAVHRALLKSDDAVIRLGLLRRFQQSPEGLELYVDVNEQIDQVLDSPVTEKLFRVVDRRGAHIRVLRNMIDSETDISSLLKKPEQFLSAYEKQVNVQYDAVNRKINKGIIRSVVFLVITKFLIGIGIEIPYDYWVVGAIVWVPLLINLLFPPIYMLLLRTTMMLPSAANTARLVEQMNQTLYGANQTKQLVRKAGQQFGIGYNIAYAFAFVAVFGSAGYVLWALFDFEIVHLVIFFIFLSAASFLGFRLSRMIRELESVETSQNGITIARDFLYMPFVVVGRYISDRYSRVNVVALMLDMLIELPLKTILRLLRQWSAFISAKKDQL